MPSKKPKKDKEEPVWWKRNWKSSLILLILIGSLPWTIGLTQKAFKYLTGASYQPASIVVDASVVSGPVNKVWDGVAQGFEKLEGQDFRLAPTVGLLKGTGVKYVRIDHVFDGYDVVSRVDGRLVYNWTKLDAVVADISASGATPFISLSYMPSAISKSDILDFPNNWGEWGQVVAATVGHYSRDYRGGLPNVIYEVWNEPDLFGGWRMGGSKNYVTLYATAANAANNVKNTKPFKIGGPATTGFYPAWVTGFYDKLDETVRIDFFSWHRYSADVDDFVTDSTTATEMIQSRISRAQDLYITEWGVNPERSSAYDSRWAGAHYLAVNMALAKTNVDMALAFEVVDGAPADKGQFHGGWGMLTNPKYGPVAKKPRFRAWEMLANLQGESISLIGEGSFVRALAAKGSDGVIRILAVNYDIAGKHDEVFPINLIGLTDGNYSINEQYLSGRTLSTVETAIEGRIRREITLNESDAVLLTFTRN